VESIKEVRSILTSVKREEEKHARVLNSRRAHAMCLAVPNSSALASSGPIRYHSCCRTQSKSSAACTQRL